MAILGGNAKPKPEQMSKLNEVEDESLLGNFLQEFSIKNIYIIYFLAVLGLSCCTQDLRCGMWDWDLFSCGRQALSYSVQYLIL